MSKPKFGVIYSRLHEIISPAAFAAAVEAMGFDSVWATEGLVNQQPALDPIVTMGELAHGSKRLTVGSCVILSPLRNPAVLAKQITSLDIVSAGRIVLGIGVGGSSLSNPADYSVSGVDPGARGARCDEGLEVLRKLWSAEQVSHRGRFYQFEDIIMRPAPIQHPHPPIWAGGSAEGVLRRTARWCNGFVPIGSGPADYGQAWERICGHADDCHRDSSKITRAVHLYCCISQTRAKAHAVAQETLTERYGFDVRLPDDGRFPFGDAGECARTIEAYRQAGVEHFVFNSVQPLAGVMGDVEQLAEQVIPACR